MKANFRVTPHPGARVPGATCLFAIDPYVVHVLEINGEISDYREVVTASRSRTTKEAFHADHDFVRRKFNEYLPLLADRLNEIHGTCYELKFWRKALALGPLRHISICFDLYQACEQNLAPQQHDCRILSESSFFVPRDFNEHRRFFQQSDFGQEQLFSAYCRLFYPGQFGQWNARHEWPSGATVSTVSRRRIWQRLVSLLRRLARRILRLRSPVVGIVNSYFSEANLDKLLYRSLGKVQVVRLPSVSHSEAQFDWEKRARLAQFEDNFDRFDKFVFTTLRYAMPRALVEDAEQLITAYRTFFSNQYPAMRWVVSEAWIGDMYTAVALAVLQQSGARHLYNEHNYFAHPFVGNNLQFLIPLVDEFATLGWRSDQDPRIVPAASLFGWTMPGQYDPRGRVVLVSSLPQVRAAEINACYGEAGPVNVPRYFQFIAMFLTTLSDATRGELIVRPYPTAFPRTLQAWDYKYRLRDCLAGVGKIDDSPGGARELMRSARLVVLDYFSTSFIESMLMDLPTVFLWNKNTRYLLDEHADFFAPLQRVGICQSDPVVAARFVESIKDDPARWWHRADTRAARDEFIAANFGQPSVLVERLLRLSASA